jgi:hypothetical protein
MPFNNGVAGKTWLTNFRKRNPELTLRTPEKTSLSRAIGFSQTEVEKFFTNLRNSLLQYRFPPHRIINIDETGIQTVPSKLPKVIAQKGQRHVGKIVGAERGETVTVVCGMSPTGIFVPPLFIFPRKRMQQRFTENGPVGSKAIAHPSGYMTGERFPEYLQHFISHTHPSVEDPVLLILDNHVSHISLAAIELCQANGIVLLTLPPHTSHKLQPLDVSFFGPFKQRYYAECDKFQINNPGIPISLGNIASLVKEALLLSENAHVAAGGFGKAGIWPYNPDTFTTIDYLPANAYEIVDLDGENRKEGEFVEPSAILPLPKATIFKKKRKRQQSSKILTAESSSKFNVADTIATDETKAPPRQKNKIVDPVKEGNSFADDTACLYCNDKFGNSRAGEKWIRCRMCMAWAHNDCAGVSKSFVHFDCEFCTNCSA